MTYEVLWLQEAVDDLMKMVDADHRQALRLVTVVRSFGRDGRGDFKKLSGRQSEWRLRSGNWRIHVVLEGSKAFMSGIDNGRDSY